MEAKASVVTAQGSGAVATVMLKGDGAADILREVFGTQISLRAGASGLFILKDGDTQIDHLLVGREDEHSYALHCHGNGLIVDKLMEMLKARGAVAVSGEQMYASDLSTGNDAIRAEAKLAMLKAKTLTGAKLLHNQIHGGLGQCAIKWQTGLAQKHITAGEVQAQVDAILGKTEQVRYLTQGVNIVLAGPPNSGKSTLFNTLCRQDKSIVADLAGTTRDWVFAPAVIGGIYAELTDTAGLSESIIDNLIDKAAQQKSRELLVKADMILLVLDASNTEMPEISFDPHRKTLAVLNKTDQGIKLDISNLPESFRQHTAAISAKTGEGMEQLAGKIAGLLGVDEFDLKQPVCFTVRQEIILTQIAKSSRESEISSLISELLNAYITV